MSTATKATQANRKAAATQARQKSKSDPAATTGKTVTRGPTTATAAKPNGTAEQKAAAAKLAGQKSGGKQPVAPPSPYLTPAQLAAEQKYDTTYGYNVAGLQGKLSAAKTTEGESVTANNLGAANSTDAANQAMAARGLFESSIRDSDLNDIASTLAMRNNILQTNLGTLTTSVNNQLGADATNYGIQHNLFNAQAVANAQAETPATGSTSTGSKSSGKSSTSNNSYATSGAVAGLAAAAANAGPNAQSYATSPAVAALAGAAASGKVTQPKNTSSSSTGGVSPSIALPSAPAGMGA